ncbi:hypothetical protein [Nocardia seriolae]|uniref:Uncharacterized protein n=1 Tax=Nocardia seriolae TaxID=37332 RepID=A0A0B8NN69_9NOCA|nr:hypothetical protein [Nocardia seriolae]APA99476.1 hypothetical protein NS506_05430 [Nocardia seriolae]MTJ63139.1 hypothetical protein [Nocardia seriolae]MTJ74654.1 hypothetical protein [Nocardia seriolae]MTJ89053.1 hypothetical protein [Nocardia seriolae]MTK33032.1 hypothetical protein [Nocardia seriolae]
MPLHLPEPPADVPDKIKGRLHALADGGKFSTKALRATRKDQLELSTPHEVFTMGLGDLAAGAGLDRAHSVGWRYLVTDGKQIIASAETTPDSEGNQEVSQFTEGPFVLGTDKALEIVRQLPQLEKAGYELRLLRIPALYLMALWLRSPTGDLLVPLEPSPIGKEGKPVPADQFLGELAELAHNTNPPA